MGNTALGTEYRVTDEFLDFISNQPGGLRGPIHGVTIAVCVAGYITTHRLNAFPDSHPNIIDPDERLQQLSGIHRRTTVDAVTMAIMARHVIEPAIADPTLVNTTLTVADREVAAAEAAATGATMAVEQQ